MADVEFGTSDISAMVAEMENEDKAGKFQSKYWSPKKEGVTKIRFLPNLKSFGEKLFYQKHMIHYVNGRPYLCLNQTLTDKDGNLHEAEECPLCKKSKQFYNLADGDKDSIEWKKAGDLRAKERFVSRVIVRGNKNDNDEDIEFKPEFYEFGTKIREVIMTAFKDPEMGDPLNLKVGRDFNLKKTGTKRNTDYSGSNFSVNTSPIFTDATKLKALMAELPNLSYSQLVEFESVDTMKNVLKDYLSGGTDDDDEPTKAVEKETDPIEEATYASKPAKKHEEVVDEDEPADDGEEEDIDALLNSF